MSKLTDRIGTFTAVPNSVIKLWPVIGVDGMALFLYLRYRTNSETEVSFPSYDTIKKDTTISRNRIAKAIRALEAAGVMERKRRFGDSTLYTLKAPISPATGLMEDPPVVPQRDDSSPVAGRSLVPQQATNKNDLNKIKVNKKELGADKPRREPTEAQKELSHLEKVFCELTGLSAPAPKTDKERRAAAEMWWQPLTRITGQASGQIDKLLRETVDKMRKDGLTIASPKSVEKVAMAIYGEHRHRFRKNTTEETYDPFASLNRYLTEQEQENGEVSNA